jgi:voltage-gated potassium channel
LKERTGLNRSLFWLYEGHGRWPFVFRWAMLIFDFATIVYFLLAPFASRGPRHYVIDYAIGAVILLDLIARFYIARSKRRFLMRFMPWADLVVVITMFAPLLVANLAFLRVLRAVRAIRAFTFIRRAGRMWGFITRHELVIDRVTNLIVFVFIMASIVYVSQVRINDDINSYLDALYFTVASLTTTGYGDVLLVGESGKFMAILIMVLGLTLFLRLVRAIIKPTDKVRQECETCGLMMHDPDAVHCKHCGAVIHIQTQGLT